MGAYLFSVNLFSVVRFRNNPCTGTDSANSNGTCYSSQECSDKGGSNVGSCAGGYGVCCTCELISKKQLFFNISSYFSC